MQIALVFSAVAAMRHESFRTDGFYQFHCNIYRA